MAAFQPFRQGTTTASRRGRVFADAEKSARPAFSILPDPRSRASIAHVSETTQPVPAFGKKAKEKKTGGGLLALGIFGIIALVLAAAMVLTSMSAA